MKFASHADFAVAHPLKLSLQDELRAFGIDVIPKAVVHKHMRDTIRSHRVGIYKIFGPFLCLLAATLTRVMFYRHIVPLLKVVVAVFAASVLLSIAQIPLVGYVAVALFAFFFISAVFLLLVLNEESNFARASMIWGRSELNTSSAEALKWMEVPDHLIPRVVQAGLVPKVRVNRLRFGPDPIIEVSRRRFLLVERAHIGGWDTGVPEIDNF